MSSRPFSCSDSPGDPERPVLPAFSNEWMAGNSGRNLLLILCCGTAAAILSNSAMAQGAEPGLDSPWIADTTVADTLQTRFLTLQAEQRPLPDRVEFEIGFSTREVPDTGFLFDSLTLALALFDGSRSTVVVTADAFGLNIAPLSPNGLLGNGGITVTEVPPVIPALENDFLTFAYRVEVALPQSLIGQDLQTSFDFFNNDDGIASRGYVMVIPEPSPGALLLLGGGITAGFQLLRGTRRS